MSEKSSDMLTLGFAMKNLKKKAAALGAVAAISLGLVATTVAPAQAFSTIEMHQACRLANYGHDQGSILWSAQLTYPDQGVYGWRCYFDNAPWASWYNQKYSLNVQLICNAIYGGTARFSNQSDAYSWYCG